MDQQAMRQPVMQVALLLLLLSAQAVVEGRCVVQNKSKQEVVVVPVAEAALQVVVKVGATVVLEASQQLCYIRNKHSGHQKGPIKLDSAGIYAIVDASVAGQVNICVATLLGGLLDIGVAILVGI